MTAAGTGVANMFQHHLPVQLPFVKTNALDAATASSCSCPCQDHGINEVQPMNLHGEQCNSQHKPMDTFSCNLLTVRIIQMRNLQKADVLSQSDCYVTLWLPTASCEKLRTKTINNCKDPTWNESFYYRIQKQVKNVLELGVCDEDVVTPDDHLFTVRFDISRLPDEGSVLMTFKPDPQAQEELDVEFLMEPAPGPPETIITNGVLVCREVCTLDAEVDQSKTHKSKRDLSLAVKGSCEGNHCFKLGSDAIITPPCPTTFHFVKYNEPSLDVTLPKKKPRYNPCTCSYKKKPGVPTVMLNSLPKGERVPIVEEKKYNLHVTVNDCNCSCPGDLDVRLGYDLCPQEQDFLCKRKRRVAQALKQVLHLGYDLKDHEIPVVAIMTTGGGTRSFTTTYGSVRGLQKLNLLDCVTYISGLSGTCWAMAHMYRDPYWSHKNLDELISEAKKQVTKNKMGAFSIERLKYYKQQLNQRKQEGYKTSFIDLWGLIVEYLLNDGKDNHKLSEQREALIEGQNPLPIYVALNIKEKYSTQDFKEWVEFTPYEVGFLKYGTFVHPENFGSEFFMGRMINKLPESRISYLHGMWSSIFSVNLLYLLNKAKDSEEFWHKWTRDKIIDLEEDPYLPTRPYELKSHMYVPAGNLSSALRGVLTDRLSVAQYHNFLKGLQLHNRYLENEQFQRWKATVLDDCPNQLTEHEDHVGVVDAGFFINTSCPPLLRRERNVDVILHLSYSAGSQTVPLEEACKFYSEQGIPFPNVVLTEEDRKNPKECYYFNQTGAAECPDVLFFPLVNDTFQHYRAPGEKRSNDEMDSGKVDVSGISSPYGTYLLTYSDDDFDKLVNLSEYNILNNQHMILQALHAAVARKRQYYSSN